MVDGYDNVNKGVKSPDAAPLSDYLNNQQGGVYANKQAFQSVQKSDLTLLGFAQPVNIQGDHSLAFQARSAAPKDAATLAKQLEAKYGVSFSKNGETASVKGDDGKIVSEKTHAPTIRELRAVQEALEKDPSARGVKFYFLDKSLYQNPNVAARFDVDASGHPAVFCMPALDKLTAATSADRKRINQDSMSLELLHELAHHEHPTDNAAEQKREKANWESLGWKLMPDHRYAIAGKDGHYYEPVEKYGYQDRFLRKDAQGYPVDAQDKPTADESKMVYVDFKTMASAAKIPPMIDYVPHPEEEVADALANFRLGSTSRGIMVHYFKPLYDQTKAIDQADLDRLYPPKNGVSQKLRSPDGTVVDNTAANRASIAKFEKEAATKKYSAQ